MVFNGVIRVTERKEIGGYGLPGGTNSTDAAIT
jgi:hypothetical protein